MSSTEIKPNFIWMSNSVYRVFALGFGSGLITPAPGTWGTLCGWLLWGIISSFTHNQFIQLSFIIIGFIFGVIACHRAGDDLRSHDHGSIVWDEIIAIWLVLYIIGLKSLFVQILAVLIFRFFDIIKPWPIRYFDQKLENAFGTMIDDIIAAFFTLLLIRIIVYI